MLNLTDRQLRELEEVAGDEAPSSYAREVLLNHLNRKRRRTQ
jgi:hypothetical protein